MTTHAAAIWLIAAATTFAVVFRPMRLPEALFATAGAASLVVLGLLPATAAWRGIAKGTDVYLFLLGMMLLAEAAREEAVFDWLAARAASAAQGSAPKLFTLLFGVGTLVTALLSNDATAVVLTPAIAATVQTAEAADPLPFLLVPAFVANAASFVLPISNPANLVIYGAHMPPLLAWLPRFALPSLLAVLATYGALRLLSARRLRATIAAPREVPRLEGGGKLALGALLLTAGALIAASAADVALGWPTVVCGAATVAALLARRPRAPWSLLRSLSWGIFPLVAGLFVLVEALERTGVVGRLAALLGHVAAARPDGAAYGAGALVAFGCNLVNNLPAGLVAGATLHAAHGLPPRLAGAVLIGTDLGPNLSVTGSLATLLWLAALRRDGFTVSGFTFLRAGAVAMPVALAAAFAGLALSG